MIFAAGLGTRLKPFTDNHPKALLPLAGKTLLQWQIDKLLAVGVTDIVVNVHHFADQIVEYLQANSGFGCRLQISDEREVLLETGGGLLKAAELLEEDEPVLVCNVDILSNVDLGAFIAAHQADELATIVVSNRETQRYLLFDEEGKLQGWTNKKTGEVRPDGLTVSGLTMLAFSGMQIVSPAFFRELRKVREEKGDKFSLIDAYLSVVSRQAGVIRAYVPQDYKMMDVGKIEQLGEAERFAEELC